LSKEKIIQQYHLIQLHKFQQYLPHLFGKNSPLHGFIMKEILHHSNDTIVIRVVDPKFQDCVIKFVLDDELDTEIEILQLLRGLSHIITLQNTYRVKLPEGHICTALVFPYAQTKPITCWKDVWNCLESLTEALNCCHGHGVIHGDFKKRNVIIANSDSLLIDFGSAVVVQDSHDSYYGKSIGTTKYMPPEVLRSGINTFAKDMWALGIMVIELIFEVYPFRYSNEDELKASIQEFLNSAKSEGKPWPWLCSRHAAGLKCDSYHCQEIQNFSKLLLTPNPQHRITAEQAINFVHNVMKKGKRRRVS